MSSTAKKRPLSTSTERAERSKRCRTSEEVEFLRELNANKDITSKAMRFREAHAPKRLPIAKTPRAPWSTSNSNFDGAVDGGLLPHDVVEIYSESGRFFYTRILHALQLT